jgi:CheY-like chemotaxis protein
MKKVLVVEDEFVILELLQSLWQDEEYSLVTAMGGHEALAILKTFPIDLVVSDVRMPAGDGIEFLQAVRTQIENPPSFIFMTAYSDLSEIQMLHQGAIAVLRKPFEFASFVTEVKTYAVQRSLRWRQDWPQECSRLIFQIPQFGLQSGNVLVRWGTDGFCVRCSDVQVSLNDVFCVCFKLTQDSFPGLEVYARVRWILVNNDSGQVDIGFEIVSVPHAYSSTVESVMSRYRTGNAAIPCFQEK